MGRGGRERGRERRGVIRSGIISWRMRGIRCVSPGDKMEGPVIE